MGLRRWMGYETDLLISPLPLEECISRLRDAVVEDGGATFGQECVVGTVGEDSLRLRKALQEGNHNSFQTYLRATLESQGMSTRLTCCFGPHPFVAVFTVFWLFLALAIAVAIVIINAGASDAGGIPSPVVLIPFMLAPMGIVVVALGRRFARGERQYLLDFLGDTIEVRPAPASAGGGVSVVQR